MAQRPHAPNETQADNAQSFSQISLPQFLSNINPSPVFGTLLIVFLYSGKINLQCIREVYNVFL